MEGKQVVITGGTSGIGRAAAVELARRGAEVVVTGRDPRRAEVTLEAMRRGSAPDRHRAVLADMASLAEVERMAQDILGQRERLDILINNAGSWFLSPQRSADGYEKTFAVNHLSHFLLTARLLPRLIQSEDGRVITTSSSAHTYGTLPLDDPTMSQGLGGQRDYARSKLANVLFTRELARRLAGTDVFAASFHPGFIDTNLGMNNALVRPLLFILFKLFGRSVDEGASTAVYLATAPRDDLEHGAYYRDSRPVTPAAQARDDGAARRLWQLSEKLTAVQYNLL